MKKTNPAPLETLKAWGTLPDGRPDTVCGEVVAALCKQLRETEEERDRLQEHEEQMRRLAKKGPPLKSEGALIDYDTHMPLAPEFIARCKKAAQLVFGKKGKEE